MLPELDDPEIKINTAQMGRMLQTIGPRSKLCVLVILLPLSELTPRNRTRKRTSNTKKPHSALRSRPAMHNAGKKAATARGLVQRLGFSFRV